jgi:enediyne biosynthesis protein E3
VLSPLRKTRTFLLGIPLQETTFARRGFYAETVSASQHLERCGQTFVYGYNSVLEDDNLSTLVMNLQQIDLDLRGFAYEGAAMGLALLDYFTPWRRRLLTFMAGTGNAHIYMLHVGLGWTLARLPRWRDHLLSQYDPLLRWLALDGYGFHEGYFSWQRMFRMKKIPRLLVGYERRAFDQGLGRSLWFVEGATISRIVATIEDFPLPRQADLWSGVGLACAYAGGGQENDLRQLRERAGSYWPHLALGVTFAAKARQRAGNMTDNTRLACQIICGLSSTDAAGMTDTALQNLPSTLREPTYELWRRRIQANFVTHSILSSR